MMDRVFISAMGINNAIGNNWDEVCQRLLAPDFQSGLVEYDNLFSGHKTWIGPVVGGLPEIPKALGHFDCRNNQLCLAAYLQIQDEVERALQKYGRNRVGVVLGTSTSGIAQGEEAMIGVSGDTDQLKFNYQRQKITNLSSFLASIIGLKGIHYTVSTACSSSSRAVIAGSRLIKAGLCDAVIVGGSDSLCRLTLNGFDSLDSVSQNVCQPFSKNRDGINIGEGAALFLLSAQESEIEILGTGESSDGYHFSAPHPEGLGAELALKEAIRTSGIEPGDLGYINLHGTATPKNDLVESKVVNRLFANETPCSSTKPLIGHTLGAAGAQELAFAHMVASQKTNPEGLLPIHFWDKSLDESLCQIGLVQVGDRLESRICMTNNFGFGGNNTSIILGAS